ncbi:MAG: hypothetical protein ACLTQG_30730 [Hungatella sp.]|uniref:hypothetical protein n=1 Tax=Hungatella sp. TaxID=2613924 RepID=UPI0039921A30
MTGVTSVWRIAPQFLDGYPNDGSVIVDTETKKIVDYNTIADSKEVLPESSTNAFKKGILDRKPSHRATMNT